VTFVSCFEESLRDGTGRGYPRLDGIDTLIRPVFSNLIKGRRDELSVGRRLLDSLLQGPSLLIVEGEPGIGKTALFEAIVFDARSRGVEVLRCSPSRSAVRLSQAGLIELLDGIDPALVDGLPPPQRSAMRIALRWDEPGASEAEPQTVAAALATILRRVAEAGPVLVAVDDLSWVDAASTHALEFALRRQEGLSVGALATVRTGEGEHPRPLGRSVDPARVERLALGPLDATHMHDLLCERLETDISERLARRIHRSSRGNPLHAIEVGRAVLMHGEPPGIEPLPVPDDVRLLVEARLRELPADTASALLEAAATSHPSVPPLCEQALAGAERAGIIRIGDDGAVAFLHPLYQVAVYAAAPMAHRRQAHAWLAQSAVDPEERARHLGLAAVGPDASVAAALASAADSAARRGAVDVAAQLAERAWRLTPPRDGELAADRALASAERHLRIGEIVEARRILEELLADVDGRARGRALRLLGEVCLWGQSLTEAVAAFEESLPELGDDPVELAAAHMGIAFALFQLRAHPETVAAHGREAVRHAEAANSAGPLGEALAVEGIVRWLSGGGYDEAQFRRAAEVFDERRAVPVQYRPKAVWATAAGYSGHLAFAVETLEDELRRCRLFGAVADIPYIAVQLTTLSSWRGEAARVAWVSREEMRSGWDLGSPLPVVWGMGAEVTALAMAGEADAARARGREAVALAAKEQYAAPWGPSALAKLELSLGDAEAALRWAEPVLDGLSAETLLEPSAVFIVPDAVEAMITLGEHTRAEALLEPFAERSVLLGRAWTLAVARRCRAMLLAARGEIDAARTEAIAAVQGLESMEMPVELGRAFLLLGQIERRRRQRRASRTALETAARIFGGVGAALWEERARAELERTWAPSRDGRLTAAERRVANLAAGGLTNPQIATQLFISRRTVEATLSRVYKKLRIGTRAELDRALAGRANPGNPPVRSTQRVDLTDVAQP
jgi:DNA-binding CsgD family transcriptional regulator